MQNMMIIDTDKIQTSYGIFGGVTAYDVYDTGELKSVILSEKNMLVTHAGELVPAYTENTRRKYKPSVEFYKSGMVKSVALENQQELITPIGDFPAELITFFDTGEINRIFPLDGKISGFWSEEDEKGLNIPFNFELGFTDFSAMLSSICFYKSGDIRSITLFPAEKISVNTKYGEISVRNGISLYESGELESCEPMLPTLLSTPIGKITAYDNEALGINADSGSLVFDENGELKSLITTVNKIAVQTENGELIMYKPKVIPSLCDDNEESVQGLKINFSTNGISFNDEVKVYSYEESGFTVMSFSNGFPTCSPSNCANCSLCGG